jgi:photosystem II stability/assembly factor-like uncharacterized protein
MQSIKGQFVLPAFIVVFVILTTLAFSSVGRAAVATSAQLGPESPLPTATEPGTVPPPTATPTRRPYPTATPARHPRPRRPIPVYMQPTATAQAPLYRNPVLIEGTPLRKVIGDRLSSTLYAYTFSNWLYRSNDNGQDWQLVTMQPGVDDFVMSPANPDVLYSGAGAVCDGQPRPAQPFYRSLDGGANWSRMADADDLHPVLALASDSAVLFAAGCDAPYLTSDGGISWLAKPDLSQSNLWQIFRLVDMASTAQTTDQQTGTPTNEQIIAGGLAADGSGVVVFTNDLGNNWVKLTPNVYPALWGMSALAVDAETDGLLAFAEPRSVWQTINFGVNWQIYSAGLETVAQRDLAGGVFGLNDLLYHENGRLYLATVRGLYSKEFSEQDWTKITGTSYDNVAISGLLYTETNPTVLWLNTAAGVYQYPLQ